MDIKENIKARITELKASKKPYRNLVIKALENDLAQHSMVHQVSEEYLKEDEILAMLPKARGIPKPY